MRSSLRTTSLIFLIGLYGPSCSSPPDNIIILCAGDSLTNSAYPGFLKEMLIEGGIRARVLNHGRNGNTSGEYLDYLTGNFLTLAEEKPDVILLQLGTNDVREDGDRTSTERFYENMKQIIRRFQDMKTRWDQPPLILLGTILPIPTDQPYPFAPRSSLRAVQEINPVIRRIALEEGLTLVDNFSLFAEQELQDVHPDEDGYRSLANNWYTALLDRLDR